MMNKLVYSTETGRIDEPKLTIAQPQGDGIVRLKRETKGRKGKGVTLIEGVDSRQHDHKALCAELKKHCGCGGAVKNFVIEIQGDVREKIKPILEKKGMQVKLAGG